MVCFNVIVPFRITEYTQCTFPRMHAVHVLPSLEAIAANNTHKPLVVFRQTPPALLYGCGQARVVYGVR